MLQYIYSFQEEAKIVTDKILDILDLNHDYDCLVSKHVEIIEGLREFINDPENWQD
jgi:hypothetical protein